jgi:hypothetical protein
VINRYIELQQRSALCRCKGGAADRTLWQLLAKDGQAHRAYVAHIQRAFVAEAGSPKVHTQGLVHAQHAARDSVTTETGQQVLKRSTQVAVLLLLL